MRKIRDPRRDLPDAPPEQAAVERAIRAVVERLSPSRPRLEAGQGLGKAGPGKREATPPA